MGRWSATGCLLVISLSFVACQLPPRLQIPGAVPLGGGSRPAPFRLQNSSPIISNPRLRRPNAIPSTTREVRPVIEEVEEPNYPSPSPSSAFDDEVNKILQSSRDEEDERQTPLPFRPERPVPISRDQIRERNTISRPQPAPRPQSQLRQEIREENIPIRQAPIRQQISRPAAAPQTLRAPSAKLPTRQQAFEDEEERERRRRPVVQILRKYRTDNEDGSITWGFENDDGTFKEETLGVDCIIRGNYGYVDPDGVKREFSYEAGNKCDEPDPEDEEELLQKPSIPQPKNRPLPYRPAAQPQYVN